MLRFFGDKGGPGWNEKLSLQDLHTGGLSRTGIIALSKLKIKKHIFDNKTPNYIKVHMFMQTSSKAMTHLYMFKQYALTKLVKKDFCVGNQKKIYAELTAQTNHNYEYNETS